MPLVGSGLERVQRALAELRAGRMVILVDDEDRENEGDLVLAADCVTPEAINFMARHARGLICLSLAEQDVARLGLPMMVDENRTSRSTAFTVSIEAREGVTTGISAHDRAHTVRVAVDPRSLPRDIVSPGHIFPLRARPGGVLQRTGHTEGSVDLARLSGHSSSAVICEIMNDDGTMARLPDLQRFAAEHGLHILTIEDLVQFRLARDRLVRRVETAALTPAGCSALWQAHAFEVSPGRSFLALTLGELGPEEPTLVRMHAGSLVHDLLAPTTPEHPRLSSGGAHLRESLQRIEAAGRGVVVYLPPTRLELAAELRALRGDPSPVPEVSVDGKPAQREFGLGAQVLLELSLRRIRLLTRHPRKLVGLAGYGLEVVEEIVLGEG